MIKQIIEFFKDKKIAILGFGLEGKSTYNFIKKYLPEIKIDILDKCRSEQCSTYEDKFITFVTGEGYLNNLKKYDIIMKSPGISFKNIDITEFKDKITSQLELFLEHKKSFCIGITGTKGKSTTSSLIYKMLKDQNKNVELLGNIGTPIFDEIEKISKDTITVLEISSHALQYIAYSCPQVAQCRPHEVSDHGYE